MRQTLKEVTPNELHGFVRAVSDKLVVNPLAVERTALAHPIFEGFRKQINELNDARALRPIALQLTLLATRLQTAGLEAAAQQLYVLAQLAIGCLRGVSDEADHHKRTQASVLPALSPQVQLQRPARSVGLRRVF